MVEGTNPYFEWNELDLKASKVYMSIITDIITDIYFERTDTGD
jgi:hypothetical protein